MAWALSHWNCLKYDLLENAGKDLVAMNVNDVLTCGADPIMFLDYVGVNQIKKRQLARIIAGMSEYLQACNCILAGGETAEMPGAVLDGMVELSGFAIGAADRCSIPLRSRRAMCSSAGPALVSTPTASASCAASLPRKASSSAKALLNFSPRLCFIMSNAGA